MPTIQKKPLKKSPVAKKPAQNSNLAISTKDVEIKRLLTKINDLELEKVSVTNELTEVGQEYQDYASECSLTIENLKRQMSGLQDRTIYLESRCKSFTQQTQELLKLKNAMSLADEFKIDFIINNFDKINLSELETAVSCKF